MSGYSAVSFMIVLFVVFVLMKVISGVETSVKAIESHLCTQHADHVVCVGGKPVEVDGGVK